MEFKLTERQAELMTRALVSSNFRIHGLGNFDIDFEDYKRILMATFNRSREDNTYKLYKELKRKYMG